MSNNKNKDKEKVDKKSGRIGRVPRYWYRGSINCDAKRVSLMTPGECQRLYQ